MKKMLESQGKWLYVTSDSVKCLKLFQNCNMVNAVFSTTPTFEACILLLKFWVLNCVEIDRILTDIYVVFEFCTSVHELETCLHHHHHCSACHSSALAPWFTTHFCARQHICYSAYMLSPVRLSVCLSVRLSHEWISQKRLKLGSCNFHHR